MDKVTKFGYKLKCTQWLQLLLKKKKKNMITYFSSLMVGLQFFIFLTCMLNFMSILCYLLYDS